MSMFLKKMMIKFSSIHGSVRHKSLWIQLHELPVEYYDRDILQRIASSLGKPLRIYLHTESLGRARYARLRVEFNIEQSLPEKINIGCIL